jgi:hypothetical protein
MRQLCAGHIGLHYLSSILSQSYTGSCSAHKYWQPGIPPADPQEDSHFAVCFLRCLGQLLYPCKYPNKLVQREVLFLELGFSPVLELNTVSQVLCRVHSSFPALSYKACYVTTLEYNLCNWNCEQSAYWPNQGVDTVATQLSVFRCCNITKQNIFIFSNPILFAICTSTFSKLCKIRIQWHVEECLVALLCN